jgi:hypothetical protein
MGVTMPIRFRCAYCNQLMGIARRKAGTVVRCPSCASQVTVPQPDSDEPEAPPSRPRKETDAAAPIFERSDFDEIFSAAPAPAPVRKPRPQASPFAFDAPDQPAAPELLDVYKKPEPVLPQPPPPLASEKKVARPSPATERTPTRPGIWLTPGMATLVSVAAVVLLAVVFALGFLLGIFLQPAPPDEKTGRAIEAVPLVWPENIRIDAISSAATS